MVSFVIAGTIHNKAEAEEIKLIAKIAQCSNHILELKK